jgi:hypothetical protein
MSLEIIRDELISSGLHEESVNRMLEHYQDMRFHLGNGDYVEAGAHIGNFSENVANLLLAEVGEGAEPHVSVGNVVDDLVNGHLDTSNLSQEIYLTVPRMLRSVYDIRNNRDSVHVNLQIPVNHSDTHTAVRISSWILTELLREYGDETDVDEIAALIEELAAPLTVYIDSYEGKRIIMSRELSVEEEILVHLHAYGDELDSDTLSEWIIDAKAHTVKSKLGNLKQAREVHYEDGMAKITSLGSERAQTIISEHFEDGLRDVERRNNQLAE